MSQYANRHSIEWERQLLLKKEAAEEMYEALKGLVAGMSDKFDSQPHVRAVEVQAARAALAKAEGRSC